MNIINSLRKVKVYIWYNICPGPRILISYRRLTVIIRYERLWPYQIMFNNVLELNWYTSNDFCMILINMIYSFRKGSNVSILQLLFANLIFLRVDEYCSCLGEPEAVLDTIPPFGGGIGAEVPIVVGSLILPDISVEQSIPTVQVIQVRIKFTNNLCRKFRGSSEKCFRKIFFWYRILIYSILVTCFVIFIIYWYPIMNSDFVICNI